MFRKALPLNFTGTALSEVTSRPEGRRYPPVCKPYGLEAEPETEGVGLSARRDVKSKWEFWTWPISINLFKFDRISI